MINKMKTLLLTIALLVGSLSVSNAEWTKVSETVHGNILYVDFKRIRKNNGLIYYWSLTNYLKPTEFGDMSAKIYSQADCNKFRTQVLSASFYKQPNGVEQSTESFSPPPQWDYPPPNSASEFLLKKVCGRAGY